MHARHVTNKPGPYLAAAEVFSNARIIGISRVMLFLLIILSCTAAMAAKPSRDDVRLVVLVLVDQLRGDLLNLYEDRLAEDGGFKRFLQSGTVFDQALHDHLHLADEDHKPHFHK